MADNDVVLTDDVEKDLESNNMKETNNINSGDPLFLHNSDHPGMALVTTPLTRKNFLTWSRAVSLIQQELFKMMKGKSPSANMVNFAHLDEYVGKTLTPEFHYVLSTVNMLGSDT
ncbi:hypothetical protein JRO89_XS03G0106000 [Xanthoceras sorbifolium]|uniref:Retrotransposon Copia-like N-terminal domain-containing protein n=1 Tax=Xanthoceras sorbifolium TaxID=99658 RepID=A0ABQ8I9R6_9ROSI|nr:hypothetical protein JRO89_XS03G0106000 [Xanthoceras sorbifolium]